MSGEVRILLLAAGASRRFGANKLFEPLPDGTPLLVASAKVALAAGLPVLAVLRGGDAAAASLLAPLAGVETTQCRTAGAGIGHSLAWGVGHSRDAGGWLVALADMPFLSPDTLNSVGRALEAGASIAAPVHQGRRGHPVGFSRCWYGRLLGLTGDQGARSLLDDHPEAITPVPCDDLGVLRDIDLSDDLPR